MQKYYISDGGCHAHRKRGDPGSFEISLPAGTAPTDAAAFHPYTHQSGLQGWLFGRVNRLLRHRLPDGLAREAALYWLNM